MCYIHTLTSANSNSLRKPMREALSQVTLGVEESKWQSWAPTGPGLGPLLSAAQLCSSEAPPELTLALLLVLLHLNPSLSAALLPGLLLALPLPLLNVICGVVRWSGGRPRTTWQLTPPRWLAAKGTREGPADWMNGWRVSGDSETHDRSPYFLLHWVFSHIRIPEFH